MNTAAQSSPSYPAHSGRRIVLVISSLGGGGAERVMALLANEWVNRGNAVSLITLDSTADAYSLDSRIERVRLGLTGNSRSAVHGLCNNWRRLRGLRGAILERNPDVVISFMDRTNVLTLLALRGSSVPVIVSERVDPRHYPPGSAWAWLRRKLYPRAHAVVVQTDAVAEWAREFVPPAKVHVIPNPVVLPPDADLQVRPSWMPSAPFLAAMGRLDPQKGFDLLITAFAEIAAQYPDLDLLILGEGPQRAALESQRDSLGLNARITLPGRQHNAWPALAHCEIFILSSRFEGFPNALLEAMAASAPVISFDCPSGPAEIIRPGLDGFLVEPENADALAKCIEHLMTNPELRRQVGTEATAVLERFGLPAITGMWERCF